VENKINLSVVVITKNEEDRLSECLESVSGWVDEIIVVDDNSTDSTVEIARKFTDRIFIRKMEIEGTHRNWAYQQAKNSWVLSLDADERVTEELKEELINIMSNNSEFTGYSVPRRNYIGSYWVKNCGWYPSGQLKLFRKEKFKYEEVEVHPRVFLDGDCGHLTKDLIHYSYKDFGDFLNKLNKQTDQEVTKWIKAGKKMTRARFAWRTFDRFMRSYFRKKGYREGFIGFMVAFFAGFYQFISYAKYWERKKEEQTG